VRPELRIYYDKGNNGRYLLCELEYLQIGGEGDGPALWLHESLTRGQTNRCHTYENEVLTMGKDTAGNFFEVMVLELFIL